MRLHQKLMVGAMTIEASVRAQVDLENTLVEMLRFDGKGQSHFEDHTATVVPDLDCNPAVRKAIPGHLGQCAKGFFPDQREIVI
ncbi:MULTISPECIES: hypothetical protein [unclassified Mesorhizobium]|uniref:hypothetical protein n=1 Tax=unclassified Mesorhizobium TaxID=325217 RepID=UPI003335822D